MGGARLLRVVRFGATVVVVACVWVAAWPPTPATQPIAFNHARHASMGCAACHAGAEVGKGAGLPGGSVCGKCHAAAPVSVVEARWQSLTKDQSPWVRLTRLPDHVAFSHRRHVTLGQLGCASCHGDIGARTRPPRSNPVRLDMDACLGCHRREAVSEDCAACHR